MSASLAAAPLIPESSAVSNELDIPVSNKRPHELARDEAHWRAVGRLYSIQEEIINLEHGYWGQMSIPVEQALARHTHRVNRELSWYARREYDRDFLKARAAVADALGVSVEELMLTRNATESFVNLITQYDELSSGDVPPILSSASVWSPIPYPEEIGREETFY
ncbi:hypothetical protein VDR74_06255 [Xanthomonas campestris pv. campestris]|nr:hypothetical protein [Xanthomonas campestris pv. campestris]